MTSLSKKLLSALLAGVAAVCLCLGAFFTVRVNASAETITILSDADYFEISKGACTGLSEKGERALEATDGAVKLVLPSTVTSIKNEVASVGAFMGLNAVTEITLPDSIMDIAAGAFRGCTSLSKINLPENEQFTDINGNLFNGCTSLFAITIPANVTFVASSAFTGCTRLVEVCNNSTEVNIADCIPQALNVYSGVGATKIVPADTNGFVFYADEAKNPAEVYLIDYAGTANTVTLPESYKNWSYSIYNDAFRNDAFLKSVNIPQNALISEIKDGAFAGTGITEITLPQSVRAIGSSAFKGCTSLETVTFNDTAGQITAIEDSVFEGCSKLESIEIPASVETIGASAFKGCYALGTVNFNDNLKTIGESAFEGCRSLEFIEIPAGVTQIRQKAFLTCDSLSTVYLPTQASFGAGVFNIASFGIDPPILIAPDSASFGNYSSDANLADYADRLTYKAELTLVYDDKTKIEDRLHGFEYDYVLQADGKIWAQTGGMPVQEGYKSSVWYEEAGYKTVVNGARLTELLKNSARVTIYAKTEQKPTLTPATNLVYSPDKEISFADAVGWNDTLGEKFNVSISGYVPNAGEAKTPAKIKDAGTYVLSVTLKEGYGEWETPYTVTVTVSQAVLDLVKLHWTTDGVELSSSTKTNIYLYDVDGKTVPYLDDDLNFTLKDTETVISSYLQYTGTRHTVVLGEDGEIEVTYSGNVGTEAGVYTATAEISKNNNNYRIEFNGGSDAAFRGVNKTSESSDKITITKTWYIVSATTNGLITQGGAPYTVTSILTYNGGVFTAPNISVRNDIKETLVTFTLKRKDGSETEYRTIFGERLSYSEFKNVINSSIPVGDYEIIFYIAQCENEKGQEVSAVSQTFQFSVMEAPYTKDGLSLGSILGIGTAYEHKYSSVPGFAQIPNWNKLDGREKLHSIPQAGNRWSDTEYADNYGGFEIYYYVVSKTGDSGGYYTYGDYAGNIPRIVPKDVGVYTVYYRVVAPGYAPASGNYSLVIYDEINLAEVQQLLDGMNVQYNGEARKLNLDTDKYRAIYLDDAANAEVQSAMTALGITSTYDYVNANEEGYPVALAIRDTHSAGNLGYLYRWTGWQENPNTAYVKVMLKVDKADNNAPDPTVMRWEWNDYDPVKNAVSWSTDWVKDTSAFTFELEPVSGGQRIPYADFGIADSGEYWLVATCPEGANYKAASAKLYLLISPAEIAWKTAPHVDSWKYGDFEKIYSVPAPVLKTSVSAIQEELINGAYFLREGSTERYANIYLLRDENGELPAGRYELVYSRSATANYAQFEYRVSFQVLKADNYWDIAPVVRGWSYGDKSIDYLTYKPDYAPHYGGTATFRYRTINEADGMPGGWCYSLADLGLDIYGKLSVGSYEVEATVAGSENYESMTFTMIFKVTKAQNSWDEIPNVVSWNEGRIRSVEDFIMARSANGTVLITITDSNGKVIVEDELIENINVNKLRSLGAGAYALKAYVAESDSFDKLEAYVDFAVFEDSVSQTAIIVLTVIFAVIAIALAIVGVVLLVRRDRKLEEEFRKMIKAELNRR